MATGRTISASFLTDFDERVISLCEKISTLLKEHIPSISKNSFWDEFGKISYSRDGGLGLGGGKLQRDALCTRGRGGKAPFSNRNLRWHPLMASAEKPIFAKEIKRIEIEDDVLIFVIENNNKEQTFPSDKVYELEDKFVATTKHWVQHVNTLKTWNDTQWTQNSCIIPSFESCQWFDAVETFAILGIAAAVELYKADFSKTYNEIIALLKDQNIDKKILPTQQFPKIKEEITTCPVTKISIASNLNRFRKEVRPQTWQPNWRASKKDEGNDSSIQLTHIKPLIETEIRHTAENVRYGFRWSNIAMTDHCLDETLDFMEHIVKIHRGGTK